MFSLSFHVEISFCFFPQSQVWTVNRTKRDLWPWKTLWLLKQEEEAPAGFSFFFLPGIVEFHLRKQSESCRSVFVLSSLSASSESCFVSPRRICGCMFVSALICQRRTSVPGVLWDLIPGLLTDQQVWGLNPAFTSDPDTNCISPRVLKARTHPGVSRKKKEEKPLKVAWKKDTEAAKVALNSKPGWRGGGVSWRINPSVRL